MKSHQLADLFPMMNAREFDELCKDMAKNGYRPENPIVTYQGKILDGRNRFKASEKVGVMPMFTEYAGGDPLEFVLSQNLHRRHLNETQRAGVAAKLANMERGGDRPSKNDSNFESANLPNGKVTQSEAAARLNVSDRTLRTFKAVSEKMPELVPLMESGELTANKARLRPLVFGL